MVSKQRFWLSISLLAVLMCFIPAAAFAAVTSISPTTASEGSAVGTLTVNGSGFSGTSQVTWTPPGGTARTLTRLSQTTTKLTAAVLSSDLPNEGSALVSVTGSGAGGPITFTVTEADSLSLAPQAIAATTNLAFSGTVATLTDTYDNQNPAEFSVAINWGDGTATDTGTATRTDVGTYAINGAHTYAALLRSTTVKTATTYPATTIPTPNNGTTSFPSSGSLVVFTGTGYQTVTYTGKTTGTSSSFTGVTGWSGSGTLAVGNPVSQPYNSVTVVVTDPSPGTATATTISPLTVADGMTYALSAGPFSTNEGAVYTGSSPFFPGSIYTGAVFPSVGLYRLLVSNGTSSAWYTLYTSGPNNYMYPNSTPGSVVFGGAGTTPYTETLYLNNGTVVASGGNTVTINDAGLSYYSAVNTYPASEGTAFGPIQVGKFLDSYSSGGNHASDFTCTVYWGDGSSDTSVPAVYVSSNTYTVSGSHTYAEEGTYTVTYDVADYGGSHLTGIGTAIVAVADPPVVLAGVAPLSTAFETPFGTQALATFTDPGGAEANDGTHYSASIDWGGSYGVSAGTITYFDGTFTVSGAVPYTVSDTYSPVVTVSHEAAAPQTVTDSLTILPPAGNDIVPSAGPGGSISPDTTQTVGIGSDSATFTITPDVGHHIVDVLVDGVSQGAITAYKFTNVTAGHTISATFAASPVPQVTSLSAYAGAPGTTITITGTDFGASEGSNVITFGGVTTTALTWSDTQITVLVPVGALEGYVGVWRDGVCSNGLYFIPFDAPSVSGISPNAGPVGSTVTITGTGFGASEGSGLVTFGGVTTTALTWSDTQITVAVPAGAPTGYVGVWQNGLVSNGILFTPGTIPVISALSAAVAPVGTDVTITGTDFGATQGGSSVTLAGETCSVQSWSTPRSPSPSPRTPLPATWVS